MNTAQIRMREPIARLLRLPRQIRALANHPANRRAKIRALERWLSWQIGSRLVPGPVLAPFVGETFLIASPGLAGVTGNIFFGLAEYEDMAFALHVLRPEELFVDVGANVGAYSVLAAGAAGAVVVAFEPIAETANRLEQNIRLNDLSEHVEVHRAGVGSSDGELTFTKHLDVVNHVCVNGEAGVRVPIVALDDVLGGRPPALVKIDVEGFEPEVLRGASRMLAQPSLLALIIEINDAHRVYGFSREDVERPVRKAGFLPYVYEPRERMLKRATSESVARGNTIFVRDFDTVSERLRTARRFQTVSGAV